MFPFFMILLHTWFSYRRFQLASLSFSWRTKEMLTGGILAETGCDLSMPFRSVDCPPTLSPRWLSPFTDPKMSVDSNARRLRRIKSTASAFVTLLSWNLCRPRINNIVELRVPISLYISIHVICITYLSFSKARILRSSVSFKITINRAPSCLQCSSADSNVYDKQNFECWLLI